MSSGARAGDGAAADASAPLLPAKRAVRATGLQKSILSFAILVKGGILGAYLPFCTLWLSRKGYSNTQLGIVAVIDAIFCLFLPMVGMVLDKLRSHNRGFILLLILLTGLKLCYLPAAHSFVWILFLTAVTAPLLRAANSTLDALALYAMDRGSFPRIRLIGDLGWGIIALGVGFAIDGAGSVDVVYWIFAVACGVLAVTWACCSPWMATIRPDSEQMPLMEFASHLGSLYEVLDREACRALLLLGIAGAGLGIISSFELVLLHQMHAPGYLLGLCKATGTLASIPVWWFTTPALDRMGIHNVQLLCLACMALRLAIVGHITNPWHALISESMAGIGGFPLIYGSITVFSGRLVSEDLKGTCQTAIFVVFAGFGAGLSPLVGGMLAELVGIQMMFALVAVTLGMCFLSLILHDVVTVSWRFIRDFDKAGLTAGP
mmetsp:Transcript_124980/g.233774  ORF Transcript_124980/g.233774 Transcript_124980/m.233774 type:complete len:434 (+) Transcript_124980:179-1480(+)